MSRQFEATCKLEIRSLVRFNDQKVQFFWTSHANEWSLWLTAFKRLQKINEEMSPRNSIQRNCASRYRARVMRNTTGSNPQAVRYFCHYHYLVSNRSNPLLCTFGSPACPLEMGRIRQKGVSTKLWKSGKPGLEFPLTSHLLTTRDSYKSSCRYILMKKELIKRTAYIIIY